MTTATMTRTLVRDHPGVRSGRNRECVHDDKISGFSIKFGAGGRATFWLRYTDAFGRRCEIRIGRHGDTTADQARKRALELKADVSLGGDRNRRRGVVTFAAFYTDRFIPHVCPTIRSHAEYEAMLRLRLMPTFGRLRLNEITTGHAAVASRLTRYASESGRPTSGIPSACLRAKTPAWRIL
jgi:Arm DNA-binding domain